MPYDLCYCFISLLFYYLRISISNIVDQVRCTKIFGLLNTSNRLPFIYSLASFMAWWKTQIAILLVHIRLHCLSYILQQTKMEKYFIPMRKCRYIYIIWCGMKSKLAQINFQRINLLTSVIKLAAADTKGTKMHWATLNSCDNWVKYNRIE